MKKLMFMVVMGLAALSAQAAQYISQCALAWANDGQSPSSDAKLANAGYAVVADHFNACDACSHSARVKMGAKYTTDPNQAITGFAIWQGSGAPGSFVRGGITYYKIGSGVVDWCPAACDGAVDLNKGVGPESADLLLYATRDPKAGTPVTHLKLEAHADSGVAKRALVQGGFTPVYHQNGGTIPADCNAGCKGAQNLFLGYRSVGDVSYRYPVYNKEGDPTSGIAHWETGSAVARSISEWPEWKAGWYVVGSDVTISGRIACDGAIHLILRDGAKLTASDGIMVTGGGNSLTIYGQAADTGVLEAHAGQGAAAIGGYDDSARSHDATGQNITINGGTVKAYGGQDASGIGGGWHGTGKSIVINGGNVTATGGGAGAGIGGGSMGASENITINGGTVNANGGNGDGAGIGGGWQNAGRNIRINGGTVVATGGQHAAGIGGGGGGVVIHSVLAGGPGENITISGGNVTANGGNDGAGIGGGVSMWCRNITISGGTVTARGGSKAGMLGGAAGIGGGWHGAGTAITISGGTVVATGGRGGAAGIGGGNGGTGEAITISGGTVTATGTSNLLDICAGIGGGGMKGAGRNIRITGGSVTATCDVFGSAVGCVWGASASNIFVDTNLVIRATGFPPLEEVEKFVKSFAGGEGLEEKDTNTQIIDILTALDLSEVNKLLESLVSETIIENDGGDLASKLAGKYHVTITPNVQSAGENLTAMLQNGVMNAGTGVGDMDEPDAMSFLSNGGGTAAAAQYISQCALAWANDGQSPSSDAKLANAGYAVVVDHFNGGDGCASSPRIKMGAKYTTDPNQAITGFAIYNGQHAPDSYSRGGITYYKIGSGVVDWCPAVCDGAVDLNKGAGGDFLFLYATRDPKAGMPVTHVRLSCDANAFAARMDLVSNGFTPVYDQVGAEPPADCNSQCKGAKKLFLGYKFVGDVSYRYPVYNTAGDPTSGIARWETGSVVAAEPVGTLDGMTGWQAGWYVIGHDMTILSRISCHGAIHLILKDGVKLTAAGGFSVTGEGNSLTIYSQAADTGVLEAYGGQGAAAIGGVGDGSIKSYNHAGENITINGGTVKAYGGLNASAIGGGWWGVGRSIVVNGGRVTATGGGAGAAIGGGSECAGEGITINGGTVNANGGSDGAAIGGGLRGDGRNIRINGGTVVAKSGQYASGIGGGGSGGLGPNEGRLGEKITITGGNVTATGGACAAGIGGTWKGAGRDITISGGTVVATGGICFEGGGAGIGGGMHGTGSRITISGGTVTANGGGGGAAGIGGGGRASGVDITISGGKVTATGSGLFPGVGAGIGGGHIEGVASNIRITGGTVTAITTIFGSGIGCQRKGAASNIFVDTNLLVRAIGLPRGTKVEEFLKNDLSEPELSELVEKIAFETIIDNDGGDLASKLAGKCCVRITPRVFSAGENLTATFQNGVCTISGTGAISEAADLFEAERAYLGSVVFGSGVTSVPAERFSGFPALSNVTVAASVRRIGAGAFANCPSLARVDFLGDELPTIEDEALVFTTSIEMKDGVPVVAPSMVITVGGRMPTLMGTKALGAEAAWEAVTPGHEAVYRFFRYEVK